MTGGSDVRQLTSPVCWDMSGERLILGSLEPALVSGLSV